MPPCDNPEDNQPCDKDCPDTPAEAETPAATPVTDEAPPVAPVPEEVPADPLPV